MPVEKSINEGGKLNYLILRSSAWRIDEAI